MSEPYIIKKPKVSIEKRPGPNYSRTPTSERKYWDTAKGNKLYGGMWYKNDNMSVPSIMVHKIYNSRLINKYFMSIANKIANNEPLESERDKETADIIKSKGTDAAFYKSHQHIDKIDINSLYGAFGNEYFHLFDINNAIDITLGGQELIKHLADSFNNYFKNEFWKNLNYFDKEDPANACLKDVVVAVETDSVIGTTEISMPSGNETIENLWNKSTERWNRGESLYGKLDNTVVYTVNENKEIEEKSIKHIMKHTVNKRLFEIIDENGDSVTITEDHSLIVYRSGKIISIKPTQIIENDQLIKITKNK